MIADALIESTKSRIVEVIQSRIDLRPRGRKFYALCPFHSDSRPSFEVNPQKLAWFCNPCGQAGDVFDFLMKFHTCDFKTACEMLGLRGENISAKKMKHFEKLQTAAEAARDNHLAAIKERQDFNAAWSRKVNSLLNENPDDAILRLEMRRLDVEANALLREKEFVLEIFRERMQEIRSVLL